MKTYLYLTVLGLLLIGPQSLLAQQQNKNSSISSNLLTSQHTYTNPKPAPQTKRNNPNRIVRPTTSLASSLLRTFIRTNSMRAYNLDLHTYRAGQLLAGDAAHLDSNNFQHQQTCRKQLLHYNNLLLQINQFEPTNESLPMEALRLADQFGRPPAGLLEGNQFWLGSYDTCTRHQMTLDDSDEKIRSQYCLGLAQFASWNPQETKTSIKVGLCLPESCTNFMLNQHQKTATYHSTIDNDEFKGPKEEEEETTSTTTTSNLLLVEQMMRSQFVGSNLAFNKLKLRSIYCLPHKTSPIRQLSTSAKLLVALVGSFSLLTIYATLCDYFDNKLERETRTELVSKRQIVATQVKSSRVVFIESFSLFKNINKLMSISNNSGRMVVVMVVDQQTQPASEQNNFNFNQQVFSDCITGIRCIGLIWIIAAHTFLVSPVPGSNLIDLDKLTSTILANIYLSAHLMVDTFFAISGLLAAYLLFKQSQLDTMKPIHWLILTLHRYWRLTPVYLICYWFTKSLGHLLNEGPLWDYATSKHSPRYQCNQESWLDAILHLSDFKSPKEHCVPFAWFIANGIKFWLITPIIVTAIHKSTKQGYKLVGLLLVANMALVAKLAFSSNVDIKSVLEFRPESAENMLNNMDQVYTRPYSRIGAYLVGLLAGHVFFKIETKQVEINLSKNLQIIIWTLFGVTTIVLTFVTKLANNIPIEDSTLPYIFGICSALIRPLWALCSCWFIFALAHGQARWVAHFLSANIWKILVKLSFSAYLIQGEVIAHLYLSQSESIPFTYLDLITRPIVTTMVTLLISVLILLFVEYPLIGIEQLVLPAKMQHRKKANNHHHHTSATKPIQPTTETMSEATKQKVA